MPELPEVETIKCQLQEKIVGLTIRDIEIKKKRLFIGESKKILDSQVRDVRRRAKQIIIDLRRCHPEAKPKDLSRMQDSETMGSTSSPYGSEILRSAQNDTGGNLHLLIHLKMTGQLVYADKKGQFGGGHPTSPRLRGTSPVPPFGYQVQVPNKYTYVTFTFSDRSHLYYNDLRQFGWIKIVTSKELEFELEKFGPEPLSSEFTADILKERLQKYPRKKVKPTLMDQGVVAGLGNIYAAEICFRAGIMPDRKIATLSDQDFKNLYVAIKKVLPLAIKYKGTSADAYVTLEGKQGTYRDKLWVYGRTGFLCPNKCGEKVKKMQLGGRGTFYCTKCQK